ncbi:MAG: 8-oxoguanine deaminase [Brevibacterium sp.]|uniref:8-oxoguanine deaminase n=1 Tax=Brevibacterium sp. TaxID=1701 RepID=UPI00264976DC|nr:8-oxoguanine deaminase [Brevibacterium sp.]MDN5807329.1 8-oxoguanine deaminase [Brevibacterium sp.]MDN5833830.1 8-oxoguanine deaminase [Brevibacterium sp.]MDN5875896.1 8-oxoguanine deaminase [Brevibacterium sp.]MDN5910644.1 8-oxoguanine deaminase [Brevibacterium sp.]MDN6123437.1 8-oxoguanine deaminase [Brevibacterium sp.]
MTTGIESSSAGSPAASTPADSTIWLRNPMAVHLGRDIDPAQASGGIVVDQQSGVIVELVPAGGEPTGGPQSVAEVVDASQHVITPGLINTHHHFYQTLTRAWAPVADLPLFGWLTNLYPVWARLTPEALELATTVAMAELLESGCTTAADHHYLFPTGMDDAIDLQVEATRRLGMRAMLTRGSMSLGEKDGGLPPQQTVQDADVILADSRRLVETYHERGEGAQVQIGFAPCSPFSVTTELMRDSAILAEELDVRLHTHLAETLDEEEFCRERFGLRTVDYLESVGWLSDRSWLAHGVHFDDDEIARLGEAGASVAHCPTSNMRLASGIARAVELEDAGVNVGLGVDGSASNDASNLIREVRQALYIQRLRYGSEAVTSARVLDWATRGSAAALGREDIGRIEVGKQADLALFRLDGLAFSGSHDPIPALVLCGAEKADRVMVAGRWRVLDGNAIGSDGAQLDKEALIAAHQEEARKLVGG